MLQILRSYCNVSADEHYAIYTYPWRVQQANIDFVSAAACMLCICPSRVYCMSQKVAVTNNIDSMIAAFSSNIPMVTLVKKFAAVARRSLTFRIRNAQITSMRSSVPTSHPKIPSRLTTAELWNSFIIGESNCCSEEDQYDPRRAP